MEKLLYSVSEAAKEIGVTRQTIYDWLKSGKAYSIYGTNFLPADLVKKLKDEHNGKKKHESC